MRLTESSGPLDLETHDHALVGQGPSTVDDILHGSQLVLQLLLTRQRVLGERERKRKEGREGGGGRKWGDREGEKRRWGRGEGKSV